MLLVFYQALKTHTESKKQDTRQTLLVKSRCAPPLKNIKKQTTEIKIFTAITPTTHQIIIGT